MSPEIAWLVMTIFGAAALVRGWEFRRGSNRDLSDLYRNTTQPNIYRHLPLVLPYIGAYLLIVLAGTGIFHLVANPESRRVVDGVLAIVAVASIFGVFSLSIFVMYRPPRWLVPRWLVEEDRILGYTRPRPGWFDRLGLATAIASLCIGLLVVGYAIVKAT